MSKLAQGRLCVIHNNVAEASVKLEVSEQRVVAYLTSLINREDKDFQVYSVAIKDLADLAGIDSSNLYKEVKETTKSLMKKVMSLKPLDGRPGELQIAWLSKARYIDGEGTVELCFDPDLKPYLLQLKAHFTKYPLQDVIRFKSQFSMPIYLLLKQHLKLGYRQFTIDELQQKLGLTGKYAQYGVFKLKVITMAQKEINEKTSIDIDFAEIREGRKVAAVRFTMKSKPDEPKTYEEEMEQRGQIPLVEESAAADQRPALLVAMAKILGDDAKAAAYYEQYGPDYCRANLEYTLKKAPKNPGRYYETALEKNYAKYSEAAAVAAGEQPGKPDPACPKCHGQGWYVGKSPTGYAASIDCECKAHR